MSHSCTLPPQNSGFNPTPTPIPTHPPPDVPDKDNEGGNDSEISLQDIDPSNIDEYWSYKYQERIQRGWFSQQDVDDYDDEDDADFEAALGEIGVGTPTLTPPSEEDDDDNETHTTKRRKLSNEEQDENLVDAFNEASKILDEEKLREYEILASTVCNDQMPNWAYGPLIKWINDAITNATRKKQEESEEESEELAIMT